MLDKAPEAFRTISEVAEELDVPQHVLRFWETRFGQIKPMNQMMNGLSSGFLVAILVIFLLRPQGLLPRY